MSSIEGLRPRLDVSMLTSGISSLFWALGAVKAKYRAAGSGVKGRLVSFNVESIPLVGLVLFAVDLSRIVEGFFLVVILFLFSSGAYSIPWA